MWLGSVPAATVRPNGLFYVQADHLGTPRAALRPGDGAIVWRWDGEPFGTSAAQETTPGGIPFKYHLRFPGQHLDTETGLHYNVMRDYDPGTGRYIQSDPIGLAGGINTYAYAGGNPLSVTDRRGLMNDDVWPIDPIGTNGLILADASTATDTSSSAGTTAQGGAERWEGVTVWGIGAVILDTAGFGRGLVRNVGTNQGAASEGQPPTKVDNTC